MRNRLAFKISALCAAVFCLQSCVLNNVSVKGKQLSEAGASVTVLEAMQTSCEWISSITGDSGFTFGGPDLPRSIEEARSDARNQAAQSGANSIIFEAIDMDALKANMPGRVLLAADAYHCHSNK